MRGREDQLEGRVGEAVGKASEPSPETVANRVERTQPIREGGRRGRAPVNRTKQAPPDLHEIYEYQLQDLLRLRRDGFSDAFAIAVGAAVALIPTCVETLAGYFWTTPQVAITPVHLAELIAFGASCAVAIVCWKISERRNKRGEEIASQVRGQPAR